MKLPTKYCDFLLSQINQVSLLPISREEISFRCRIVENAQPNLKDEIESLLGIRFHTLRLHQFLPRDKVCEHVDSAYPNMNTMIMRLDAGNDERLKVEGRYVKEEQGVAVVLEENTPHEITTTDSKYSRFTLVGWYQP